MQMNRDSLASPFLRARVYIQLANIPGRNEQIAPSRNRTCQKKLSLVQGQQKTANLDILSIPVSQNPQRWGCRTSTSLTPLLAKSKPARS